MSQKLRVEITEREAELILKYGYPFPEVSDEVKKVTGKGDGWHIIEVEKFWLEQLVGDLSRSVREVRSENLQEEIFALCESLEIAIRFNGKDFL